MNIETAGVDLIRKLALGLEIGDTKIWTATHNITIKDFVAPTSIQTPSAVNVTIKKANLNTHFEMNLL